MESNKLIVLLLMVAIVLSIVSLTVTLSVDTQSMEGGVTENSASSADANAGQVRLEVLPNNQSEEAENGTE